MPEEKECPQVCMVCTDDYPRDNLVLMHKDACKSSWICFDCLLQHLWSDPYFWRKTCDIDSWFIGQESAYVKCIACNTLLFWGAVVNESELSLFTGWWKEKRACKLQHEFNKLTGRMDNLKIKHKQMKLKLKDVSDKHREEICTSKRLARTLGVLRVDLVKTQKELLGYQRNDIGSLRKRQKLNTTEVLAPDQSVWDCSQSELNEIDIQISSLYQ